MKQYASVIACVFLTAFVIGGATPPMFAQAPTVTGVKIDIAKVSAPTVVVASTVIPIAQPVCNLAPTTLPAVTVNPQQVEWTDPALPARVCRAAIPVTLGSLVPDNYQGVASFVFSDGSVGLASPVSNPFTVWLSPIPAGLRFVK